MGGSPPKPPPPPAPQQPLVDPAELAKRRAKRNKTRVTTDDLRIDPGIKTTSGTSGLAL